MAVYVDGLMNHGWRLGRSCHLIADTRAELMEFAVSIGLKKQWYQPLSFPHFDLTESRRAAAVRNGAIELERKPHVYKIWGLRTTPEYSDVPGINLNHLPPKE